MRPQRAIPRLAVVVLFVSGMLLGSNALPFRADEGDAANGRSAYVDFESLAGASGTGGLRSAGDLGGSKGTFGIARIDGTNAFSERGAAAGDVAFYPTALASISESYSFVYRGPDSIVEPFLVNARVTDRLAGFGVNLRESAAGQPSAGNEFYEYRESAGATPLRAIKGRLRSEPYFYKAGRAYRVDVIADPKSHVLSTRVYDAAEGPPGFDRTITPMLHPMMLYPGIRNALGGTIAVRDFSFGSADRPAVRPHAARRAFDYNNYLGYNAGVNGAETTPFSLAFQRYFPALLISHVRIPADGRFLPSINAVSRFKIDADLLTGNETTIAGLKATISRLALPPDAIELWNEPNNPYEGGAYDPNFAVDLPAFAREVKRSFPNVTIWGPSILPDQNGYPTVAQRLAPSLGGLIAGWNSHPYVPDVPESMGYGGFIAGACGPSMKEDCGWYGATNWNDNVSGVLNPSLPGITSEGGASYGTYPEICGHGSVSFATQQAYVQRGMLYGFKIGHERIFPYKFVDDFRCGDGYGTFGLLSTIRHGDGSVEITPKPAYTALVYLDRLLYDGGASAARFDPKPLDYAVEGAAPDLEELLLAASDGSYRLVLWSDAKLWDFNANGGKRAGSEVAVTPEQIVVRFGQPVSALPFTQDTHTGEWRAGERVADATSLPLTLTPFPAVIDIRPRSVPGRASLGPAVATPGPVQTP